MTAKFRKYEKYRHKLKEFWRNVTLNIGQFYPLNMTPNMGTLTKSALELAALNMP